MRRKDKNNLMAFNLFWWSFSFLSYEVYRRDIDWILYHFLKIHLLLKKMILCRIYNAHHNKITQYSILSSKRLSKTKYSLSSYFSYFLNSLYSVLKWIFDIFQIINQHCKSLTVLHTKWKYTYLHIWLQFFFDILLCICSRTDDLLSFQE